MSHDLGEPAFNNEQEFSALPAVPTAEQVQAARADPKLANVLYHDWESSSYDDKWSISYDQRCIDYATSRFDHVVNAAPAGAREARPYGTVLELGCGTGFFLLNLASGGTVSCGYVTDISAGMVDVACRNAAALGLDVTGEVADAEQIPYPDAQFDLVIGHAVLHHIPDVEKSLREVLRVLKPGGRFVFCGEPTKNGDWVARRLSRATWWAATRITQLPQLNAQWARPKAELDESSRAAALESVVDLHTFDPDELARMALRAGAVDVTTATEELTASWLGWPVRTFEAAVKPGALGPGWAMFAYRSWQRLDALDARLLSKVVPAQLFYNVSITGVRPEFDGC